jgi:hypothetical protein
MVGGKRVDLKRITMPLLNFYGRYDHLVPPEACEQLTRAVGSKDTEDICWTRGTSGSTSAPRPSGSSPRRSSGGSRRGTVPHGG